MEEHLVNTARLPQPRQLGDEESLESLNHWWTQFRNFYRRDKYVGGFLVITFKWDPTKPFYGFENETDGLKRKKEDLAADLDGFMEMISSYMKHSYITERLKASTRDISGVKDCLFKLFDAEISQDTFLDLVNMKKSSSETPHQFFEKISSHVQRHLTKPNIKVDAFDSGADGDKMNLTMMNFIVVIWLEKLHPKLIGVIRLEFANDLRHKSLYELMPRIATVIPQLMQKGDLSAAINRLATTSIPDLEESNDEGALGGVNRLQSDRRGNFSKNKKFDNKRFDSGKYKKDFRKTQKPICMHCQHLNKELNADFNVFHEPEACYRKKTSIKLLNAGMPEDENEMMEGEIENVVNNTMSSPFQAETSPRPVGADRSSSNLDSIVSGYLLSSPLNVSIPTSSFSEELVDIKDLSNKIRRMKQSAKRLAVRKARRRLSWPTSTERS